MRRAWNIGTHTLLKVRGFLFHQIQILWYTSSHRKRMCLPINVPQQGKMQQNPSQRRRTWETENPGESLRNVYAYFSQSMGASIVSYGILHTMGNDWCSLQYSIVWEYVAKSILWGESRKLIAIFFPKCQWFSSIRSPSYGMLYRLGNAWVFPSISHSMGKSSKTHPMREKA